MQNVESPSSSDTTLNRAKLKAAVHYICHICSPQDLGHVKLHKILYFADMLMYADVGVPLTGVEYLKQAFGPTARHLSWALTELEAEGLLRIDTRNFYGFTKKDFISVGNPRHGALSNAEIALLDAVSKYVCSFTAQEISELSHNEAWTSARIGESIPYFTVMGWAPEEVTDQDMEAGTRAAKSLRGQLLGLRRAG